MLKSMTAYGRAALSSSLGRFVAEIQSLNRKFQDITVQLPRELGCLESEVRKWVGSQIFRGKLSVKITAVYENKIPVSVFPNLPLARQLKEAWEKIAADLAIEGPSMTLEMLSRQDGILLYNDEFIEEEYRAILENVVAAALEALIEMKVKEGNVIKEDFLLRLHKLKENLDKIKQMTTNATHRYQEKLKKHIEEVLPGAVANEERILREICIYADRIDISEEITRLESHINEFTDLLLSERSEKGKALEFFLQEMHREVNTLGSKTDGIQATKLVVDMKSEIERIKEQVQNVE